MASQLPDHNKAGSANRNVDATIGSGEQFHSRRERDEPMEAGGVSQSIPQNLASRADFHVQHKPGVLVGNDTKPEFQAQTLPPGTAPKSQTFEPNPVDTAPPTLQSRPDDQIERDATQAQPLDMPGATSGAVHTGLGHPGQGQTSRELRHDGAQHSGQGGYEGLKSTAAAKVTDPRDPLQADQRALDKDEAAPGQRGNVGGPAAEDRIPEGSERVAVENKLERK